MKVLVGPLSYPRTGQSHAFELVANGLSGEKVVIYIPTAGGGLTKTVGALRGWFKCFKALVSRRVQVMYITTSRTWFGFIRDAGYIVLAKAFRVPVVNHLHGSDFRAFRDAAGSLGRGIIDLVYGWIGESIVLHKSMRDQYSQYRRMRLSVVENCVDDELWDIPPDAKRKSSTITILYLSNFLKTKGIVELIRAFEVAAHGRDWLRLVVGGAPLSGTIEAFLEQEMGPGYKIPSGVVFLGATYGGNKKELLQSADILALPSYYESEAVPVSLLEGVVCGCALITTRWRYLPKVFARFGVLFVEPKSIESLTRALEIFADDREMLQQYKMRNMSSRKLVARSADYLRQVSRVIQRAAEHTQK